MKAVTFIEEEKKVISDSVQKDMSFSENVVSDLESSVKIPYILKKKMLATPGTWNGFVFTSDALARAFNNTRWDDKECRSLFTDHEDRKSKEWIGEVINPVLDNNTIYGDLVIVDKPTAMKLAYGAKFGISPSIDGDVDKSIIKKFIFNNFSVVINPAIKPAYINFSESLSEDESDEPYGDVSYADPGYQEDGIKRYPIDTEEHVRAAWSYINMPKNSEKYTAEQLVKIKAKIIEAAEKYKITISEEKMNEEEIKKNESPDLDKPEGEVAVENAEAKPEVEEKGDVVADMLSALNKRFDEIVASVSEIKEMLKSDEKSDKFEEKKEVTEEVKSEDKVEDKEAKAEFSQELMKRDNLITELSEKIAVLERQLSVPNKIVKKSEFSKDVSVPKTVEEAFMEHLKQIRG
jgi:hypothetical protein